MYLLNIHMCRLMTQWHVVIGTGLFTLWLFLFLDLILKTETLQTVISERKTFFAM